MVDGQRSLWTHRWSTQWCEPGYPLPVLLSTKQWWAGVKPYSEDTWPSVIACGASGMSISR